MKQVSLRIETRPLLFTIEDYFDNTFCLNIPRSSWRVWFQREVLLASFVCFVSDKYDLSCLETGQRALIGEEIVVIPEIITEVGAYYELSFRDYSGQYQYPTISKIDFTRISKIPEGLLVE